jgi:hypothetical protein
VNRAGAESHRTWPFESLSVAVAHHAAFLNGRTHVPYVGFDEEIRGHQRHWPTFHECFETSGAAMV